MLRFTPLMKYMAVKPILGEARAKELAEPEAQSNNGMGARSARLCLLLVIPLVFCTLSPLITIFGMMNFCLCRCVYGYLIMYAETLKGDMGGFFWTTQLQSIQLSMLIYILLMGGVLFERANSRICPAIAMASLLYWKYSYDRFQREHKVESLSFQQLKDLEEAHEDGAQGNGPLGDFLHRHHKPRQGSYVQPELLEHPDIPEGRRQQETQVKDASSMQDSRVQRKLCC
mmetsp:Transcript_30999/g.78051  ORF Transcript_30999/g.78051 Transcript_30999/m.78051 type:complete len:229 (-) Transcript_30999:23-709(-)